MSVRILYVCYRAGTAKRRKNRLARVEYTNKNTLTGFQGSQGFQGVSGDLNCLSKTSFLIICHNVLKFMEHFLMDTYCSEREYFIFWLNRSMWYFGLLAYIFSPAAAKLSPEPLVLGLRSRCGPPLGPCTIFCPDLQPTAGKTLTAGTSVQVSIMTHMHGFISFNLEHCEPATPPTPNLYFQHPEEDQVNEDWDVELKSTYSDKSICGVLVESLQIILNTGDYRLKKNNCSSESF